MESPDAWQRARSCAPVWKGWGSDESSASRAACRAEGEREDVDEDVKRLQEAQKRKGE